MAAYSSALDLKNYLTNTFTDEELKNAHISCTYSDDVDPGDVEFGHWFENDVWNIEIVGSSESV